VGTKKSPKKFHTLDNGFISDFRVDPPNQKKCHSTMHVDSKIQREKMIQYALSLHIEDFIICDESGQRLLVEDDLTEEDYKNPVDI